MLDMKAGTFLIYLISGMLSVSSETPCKSGNDSLCLEQVKTFAFSQSAFWFGTQYKTLCSSGADGTFKCSNARPNIEDSIISRMTGDQSFDQNILKFVINVTYELKPTFIQGNYTDRRYKGCSTRFHSFSNIKTFTIDPVDTKRYEPFNLHHMPEVSWAAEPGDIFTMVFFDVGYLAVQALSINVRGGTPSDGQEVIPYTGPLNPLDRENIYVFAVFRQSAEINFNEVSAYFANIRLQKASVYFGLVMTKFNLTGPVGLNILRVSTDQYAAYEMRRKGLYNNCPSYRGSGFQSHGQLPFIPSPLNLERILKISVDVLYTADSLTYQYCCSEFSSKPTKFLRDYSTNVLSTYGITTRRKPKITLVPKEMQLPASRAFAGKRYTLILAMEGGNKVLVHWMVINIPDGDVSMGRETLIYSSPHPDGPQKSTPYVFLLYEQSAEMKATDTKAYGGTDCVQAEEGRCHYRVADFIKEKGLTLVGLRSMTIYPDQYSRSLLYKLQIKTEKEVCSGQRYYKGPCFKPSTTGASSPLFLSPTFLFWSMGLVIVISQPRNSMISIYEY